MPRSKLLPEPTLPVSVYIARPDWSDYFMEIAKAVSRRATCPRKAVGSVLVDTSHRIVSTGYNGAPSRAAQCDEAGCQLDGNGKCTRTLHAECNAIVYADRSRLEGGCLYTWGYAPCLACAKMVMAAGITRVFATEVYDPDVITFLEKNKVKVFIVTRSDDEAKV